MPGRIRFVILGGAMASDMGHLLLRWIVVAAIGIVVLLFGGFDAAMLTPVAFLVVTGVLLQSLARGVGDTAAGPVLLVVLDLPSFALAVYGLRAATPGPVFAAAGLIAMLYAAVVAGRMWASLGLDARSRRESRELRTLLEIQEAVTSTLDAREVMSMIVSRIGEVMHAQRCSILVVDDRLGRCFVVAASDNPQASMLEIDLEKYPEIRRAVETREPLIVGDVETDPLVEPVREILLQQGYRSLMVLPLVFGREVLGTLFLRATRGEPFGKAETRFCRAAAAACANALKNALLFRDVQLEAARHRETGQKLRRVLDGTPDLIVATDPSGRITEFNRGAEALTGLPADETTGRDLREILGEGVLAEPIGDPGRREVVIARPDGRRAELSLVGAPIHADGGEPAGRVWIGRDVTELRRVEKSLAQAERLSSLGEVVAGVAHELNNPLSSVLGYAQLMLAERPEADEARDLTRIVESAQRCQRIVRNLLSFSRKHPVEKKMDDLNACVRKVLELKGYHLRSSGVVVREELDAGLPRTLFDKHQVEQVILNLLNNAEHAILGSGRPGTITLRTRRVPGFVCLEAEDDGPGVAQTIRHRVFDPFFTTKEAGQGTGLGLSVSYGIVQEHGGRIELRDRAPGESGACFALHLPATDGPLETSEAASVEAPTGPLHGRRVLVADDEPMVLDLIRRVLEREGAQVVPVADGTEAWERILDQDFDLVVADLRMPVLDGRALFERVAAERPEMVRRFVFATGDLARADTLRFLERIPNRIIRKPLDVETVRRVLGQALLGHSV